MAANVYKYRAKTLSKSCVGMAFWRQNAISGAARGANAGKLARGFGSFGGWSVLFLRLPAGACRLECRLRMSSGVVLLRMPSGVVLCEPYPTPRLGIAAPQAVSEISGCGGGAPHPIVTPHPWCHARGMVQISGCLSFLLYAAGTGFRAYLSPSGPLPSVVLPVLGPIELDLVAGSVFRVRPGSSGR